MFKMETEIKLFSCSIKGSNLLTYIEQDRLKDLQHSHKRQIIAYIDEIKNILTIKRD